MRCTVATSPFVDGEYGINSKIEQGQYCQGGYRLSRPIKMDGWMDEWFKEQGIDVEQEVDPT